MTHTHSPTETHTTTTTSDGLAAGLVTGVLLAILVLLAVIFVAPRVINVVPASPAAPGESVAPAVTNAPLPILPASSARP